MRKIGVVTVARSDFGIYRPLLHKIRTEPELQLQLIVTGMHLSPEFGLTVKLIEADGFTVDEQVEMLLASDTPEGLVKSMGVGLVGLSQVYRRARPDILVVLGDRFEMHTAALAALPFKIPVAHIHGGEITQGAIDDALRHAITKLSHLHFVSTAEYARRVVQLGEEPWRVTISGAPGLDNLQAIRLLTAGELAAKFKIELEPPPLLVTFHPVTLEYEQTAWQVNELLAALDRCGLPVIFTRPNADTANRIIVQRLEIFVQQHNRAWLVDNLGTVGYFSLMALAAAMVGNSSSGLIEAPSFKLPVVNVGIRQAGRVRAANVIDVGYSREEIMAGLHRAVDPEFRASLSQLRNPYGEGQATEKIVNRLKTVELDARLLVKSFLDVPFPLPEELADR